jgi:hypothetical protein
MVGFFPLCRQLALSGTSTVKLFLDIFFGKIYFGRTTVKNRPYAFAVGFTKRRHF